MANNYIYPPRPKGKLDYKHLGKYESTKMWIAQRKFNGTRVVIHIKEGEVNLFNRHGEAPRQFKLTMSMRNEILDLKLTESEYWLDGELLNNKTSSQQYKEKIILFDLLYAGHYLFGKYKQLDRLQMLSEICKNPISHEPTNGIALEISQNLWLAESWDKDFRLRFEEFLHLDEIEGLVLRKKDSVIKHFGNKEYDVDWLLRVRKPHKNYNF